MHTYFLDYPHSEGNSAITIGADAELFEHRLIQCFPTSSTSSNPANGSTLLKWRLVDKLWKSHVDTFLKEMWKELSNHAPSGFVDIPLVMLGIEGNEKSITLCFGKLARNFKDTGAVIPYNLMPIRVGEYRMLQAKIEDVALQKIWNKRLRTLIQPHIAALPPATASATAIRTFLNDPTNSVALSHITILNLSNMDLRVIPSELNQLSRLRELSLERNQLKEVPNFNLPNLRELLLFSNQLKEVPNFINLPNLQTLNLFDNQLKEVPNFKLPNLRKLLLSFNQLKEVPNFNLPNLQTLNLFRNQLKEVPNFINLRNLDELHLIGNQLKEVPNFTLPNLERLDLNGNQLKEVPNFINLRNLHELFLMGNQLEEVPNFNLPKLQKLLLYDNQLKEVPNFTNLPHLQDLCLRGNIRIFIPDEILKRFPRCNEIL